MGVGKMEERIPKNEYFKNEFEKHLEKIKNNLNASSEDVVLIGRIYNLYVDEGKNIALFKLNYFKDLTMNIFVDNWHEIKKYNKVKEGGYVKVKGSLGVWNSKNGLLMQIESKKIYGEEDIRYIATEKNNPKPLPKENPKIAIISSEKSSGKADFLEKLYKAHKDAAIIENATLEGDKALLEIPEKIRELNDKNEANLICIVRGGGDTAALRYIFDSQIICDAIMESKIPVLIGVGHKDDITNADRVSDAPNQEYFLNPTDLAGFINQKYYNNKKSFSKETITEAKKEKMSNIKDDSKASSSINYISYAVIVLLILYILFVK